MASFPTGAIHRPSNNYVWDVNTMAWVVETQPGGGGGGGASTIADGADVAEGSTTDAAVIADTTGTVSGKLRGLVKWAFERMPAALGQTTMAASLPVTLANNQSALPVTGTFFQSTQPVSLAVAPTTTIVQPTGTNLHVVVDSAPTTAVTGTFFQATQPVSAVSLPLPTGAATSALQTQVTPSLNTGVRDAGTQRVTIATNDVVPVTGTFFQPLVFASDKVDVSGSTGVGVTGPLTDTQLRATAVPITVFPGTLLEVLQSLLLETRVSNVLLREGLLVKDELNSLRADETLANIFFQ